MKRWLAVLSVAILAAGLVACRGGDDAQPPLPTPAATPEATATPVPPSASRVGSPPPTPKPTFEPSPDARRISGLFSDPRPAQPDLYRVVETKPPETFSPWNGSDVALYDIEAMTETNLGPGRVVGFSPDEQRFAWVSVDTQTRNDERSGTVAHGALDRPAAFARACPLCEMGGQ